MATYGAQTMLTVNAAATLSASATNVHCGILLSISPGPLSRHQRGRTAADVALPVAQSLKTPQAPPQRHTSGWCLQSGAQAAKQHVRDTGGQAARFCIACQLRLALMKLQVAAPIVMHLLACRHFKWHLHDKRQCWHGGHEQSGPYCTMGKGSSCCKGTSATAGLATTPNSSRSC
jgi:hypothetical protein